MLPCDSVSQVRLEEFPFPQHTSDNASVLIGISHDAPDTSAENHSNR